MWGIADMGTAGAEHVDELPVVKPSWSRQPLATGQHYSPAHVRGICKRRCPSSAFSARLEAPRPMREYAGDAGLVRGKLLKRFKQIMSATARCTFIAGSVQRPPQLEPLSIRRAS